MPLHCVELIVKETWTFDTQTAEEAAGLAESGNRDRATQVIREIREVQAYLIPHGAMPETGPKP